MRVEGTGEEDDDAVINSPIPFCLIVYMSLIILPSRTLQVQVPKRKGVVGAALNAAVLIFNGFLLLAPACPPATGRTRAGKMILQR